MIALLVQRQLWRTQDIPHQMVELPGGLALGLRSELQGLRQLVAL